MINKLLVLMFIAINVCSQTQNLTLWDTQPGGLNTSEPSHTLAKTDFLDINNVYTDGGLFANMREGLQTVWNSSAAPQNLYEYINLAGNRYLIVKSSQYLGYVDTDNTYKVLMATLPASARLWKVQYLNDCYLGTNQITDRWQFDPTISTKLSISTFMPCGKYFVEAFDKVFAINISTPSKNAPAITLNNDKSIVRYCETGNLKSWDGTSGDQWLGISRNDGEDLSGGFKFKGNIYVTKPHSVHQLLNVDDGDVTNDGSICVMPNIGCLGMDTIQEINGNMYWLSADGVVEWTGTSYDIISKDIQDEIDTLKNKSQATSDSVIDTTQLDFSLGSGVNIDSITYSNSVILNPHDSQINQKQDDNTGTVLTISSSVYAFQTFMSSYTLTVSTISVKVWRVNQCSDSAELTMQLQDYNRNIISSITLTAVTISTRSVSDNYQFACFNFAGEREILTKETTYYIVLLSSGSNMFKITRNSSGGYDRGYCSLSSIGTSLGDLVFRVYQLYYNVGQFGSILSQKRQLQNWNQWSYLRSNFNCTDTDISNYNIIWYISVATDTNICGINYLTKVTTNSIIPSSVGSWVVWYASITTQSIGASPKIVDVTIEYYKTPDLTEQIISSYADLKNIRYGISGVAYSYSVDNDVIYNFQIKNRKWTKFDIHARSFGKYNNEQYLGDSTGNGNINRFSCDVNTDNGVKIKTMIKTPDYVLSTRANDCRFEELWTYAEPSVLYSSMTIQYYLNKNTVGFSTNTANVSLTATSGYEDMFIKTRMKAPIDRFRTLSFKVENFEKIYGLDFIFSYQPVGTR